jgi:hypothetical protein
MFPSPIASREEGKVYRVVSGPSGRVLALVMDTLDGEVRLFGAQDLAPRGRILLGSMGTARGCALSPDDTVLAVAVLDYVVAFELKSGSEQWRAKAAGDEPAIAFSRDGQRIAVGATPNHLVVLDARDGTALQSLELTGGEPRAIAWDAHGLAVVTERSILLLDESTNREVRVRASAPMGAGDEEGTEVVVVDASTIACAGNATAGPFLQLRRRSDCVALQNLHIDGDQRAEGLAFAGGVLFIATEGGTYRADAPFDQLVRWLPPLGGPHDPTRIAAVEREHIAIAARDLRVFRTRS